MKSWYQIKAQGDNGAEIFIYDEIGFWGITAKDFIRDFKEVQDRPNIQLRINSPGGDVFDGLAIHNVMARHRSQITVTVDGIAASIASVIAMAGERLIMPENTFLMIHDPWGVAVGDAADMRELADVLDKIKAGIMTSYVSKSGQSEEKVSELMSAETWLTAAEAAELGFADEVTKPVKLAAKFDMKRFQNPPKELKSAKGKVQSAESQEQDPPEDSPPPDPNQTALAILALCEGAGVADLAKDFLGKGMTVEQVKERLRDAQAIRDACVAAKLPERAANYIKAGLPLAEVRANLLAVKAATEPEIDGKLGPETMANRNQQEPEVIAVAAINKRYRDRENFFGRKS